MKEPIKQEQVTMAQLPTDDDKARMVLDVFENFGTRPGEAVMPRNAMAVSMERGWRNEDLADGFKSAAERGWIEDGPNGTIRLTDKGFAQMAGQLPDDDEKARMVLDVFKHFGTRPGEVIMPQNAMAISAQRGWRNEDLADGFRVAAERGWIEDGSNGMARLTDEGFAQV